MAAKYRSYGIVRTQDSIVCSVTYNDDDHANCALASHEECGTEKDQNRNWDGSGGKRELDVLSVVGDDNQELDGKAEEEEEIEFEQGDVNLQMRQPPSHKVLKLYHHTPDRSGNAASCANRH
jgi:hypothetical protein